MSGVDLERELERLRAATDAIEPDDGFTDAIFRAVKGDVSDEPLAEIARATESIDASPAIADAVMERVRSEAARPARGAAPVIPIDASQKSRKTKPRAGSWTDGVTRTGPFALGLAFVAAAAGVVFFVSTQSDADATVATAVDAVEVVW
ncbi:MAG: hypothetical protein U0441_34460 [Polyangiaceae bacterium]